MSDFVVIYLSREDKCPHSFATVKINEKVIVPLTVIRLCSSCQKTHSFHKERHYLASTSSQLKNFNTYAEKLGVVEYDVTLDI